MADENAAGLIGYKLGINDGSSSSSLTPDQEIRPEEWLETNERKVVPHETMLEFQRLLNSLPRFSVTEDIQVLERKVKLGDCHGAFYSILNSTSLERSHGNVSLQDILLKMVDVITQDEDMAREVIQKSDYIIPFLVGCLRSEATKNRDNAANRVRDLAELDSGFSRKIGESGAVTSLIHNIKRDQLGRPEAIMAMLELFSEPENVELAVSNWLTTAVMEMVVRRVRVIKMLETLKMLSTHEKAIVEMVEYGILKCLFKILREDGRHRVQIYCVDIIHAMCHATSAINTRRQIKDVVDAHITLERVVCAPMKIHELLSKLQEWGIWLDIDIK